MKKVIILRGLPGSGKSTLGKQLASEIQKAGNSVEIVSADKFFYELGGGEYKFDPSKIGNAHSSCFRKFIEALQSGVNLIVVDNTNTSGIEISPYKLAADAFDYEVEIRQVESDPEESFKRNLHGVPKPAIDAMHGALQQPVPPWWEIKKYKSKTSETGDPLFEELQEEVEKTASLLDIFKLTKEFEYKLSKYLKATK